MRLPATVPLILALAVARAAAQSRPAADSTASDTAAVVVLAPLHVPGSILHLAGPQIGSGAVASTVILRAAEFHTTRPRLLTDALTYRAGATAYDDLGSPQKRSVVMRGFAASPVVGLPQGVTVLVNGIPVNEPGAGEVSFDLLPHELVDRVEVLRGTASLLGPNSLGGAVNLITRRGGGPLHGALEVEAGSFGARGLNGSLGGAAGAVDFLVGGGHERQRGWRAEMRDERTHFLAAAGLQGADRGIQTVVFGARSRAETAGSLPLSVYEVNPDSNLTAGDFELLHQINLGVSAYAPVGYGLASARVYARTGDAERFNVNQAGDPDVRNFSSSRTLGLESDWSTRRPLSRGVLIMRAGAGGLLNHTSIELHAERIDPRQTTHVESPISRAHAYTTGRFDWGAASLSAGARWDRVRVPFRNRLRPDRDTTSTFTHFSPRAGVAIRLTRAATLYASWARSFRPPALIEIACADPREPCPLPFALGDDPPIDPVRVSTIDAGITWASTAIAAEVSAYSSDVHDDIFLFPYHEEDEPAGSTIDGFFDNVPLTRRLGAAAEVTAALPAGHRVFATYVYSRGTFQTAGIEIFSIREESGARNEVAVGSRFPLIPDHTLSVGADFMLPLALSAGVYVRHVGSRYLRGDEANVEAPLPGYTLTDLRLAYASDAIEIAGLVRNLADHRYLAFGTFNINQGAGGVLERFVTPGTPRRFEISIRRLF